MRPIPTHSDRPSRETQRRLQRPGQDRAAQPNSDRSDPIRVRLRRACVVRVVRRLTDSTPRPSRSGSQITGFQTTSSRTSFSLSQPPPGEYQPSVLRSGLRGLGNLLVTVIRGAFFFARGFPQMLSKMAQCFAALSPIYRLVLLVLGLSLLLWLGSLDASSADEKLVLTRVSQANVHLRASDQPVDGTRRCVSSHDLVFNEERR